MGTGSGTWRSGDQHTIPGTLLGRLETDPDGEYLDVNGTKMTAAGVWSTANRVANVLRDLGVGRHDRVATLIENSPEVVLAWWATVRGGRVVGADQHRVQGRVPAPPARRLGVARAVVEADLLSRAVEVVGDIDGLDHVVVVGDRDSVGGGSVDRRRCSWGDRSRVGGPARRSTTPPHDPASGPSDLGTFVYTGGTTGPSKGCMLSHNYHDGARPPDRHLLAAHRRRRRVDAAAAVPLQRARHGGARRARLRRARGDLPPVLGVELLARDEPHRRDDHLDARARWRTCWRTTSTGPRCRESGAPEANTSLRLIGAAPLPVEVDDDPARAVRHRDVQRRVRPDRGEPDVVAAAGRARTSPTRRASINDEYFDVRIFDDDDNELPRDTDGEIVDPPEAPARDVRGLLGPPRGDGRDEPQLWYHTGDIGRIDDDGYLYFVDRKADYLRRRGENISSFEVESILMGHGALADVAVHAVPSELTEDDLKITATRRRGRDGDRGGAVPLVHRPAPVLRAAALHRVPRRAAAQPGRPRAQARAARRGRHRRRRGTSRPSGITYEKR